jgi:TatD DNase family protein
MAYVSDMKLFDAHCHLQDDAIFPNLGKILERAAAAGVERMAVCGTSMGDGPLIFKTVEKSTELFPSLGKEKGAPTQLVPMIGIHPWFVQGRDGSPSRPEDAACPAVEPCLKDFQTLEKMVRNFPNLGKEIGAPTPWVPNLGINQQAPTQSVGIGETGLDFQARFTNRVEQEASFAMHLDLARELDRPVTVHCVQAWGRLIDILKEHPAPRVLLHAFGGAPELIPELMALNCWFSFCGNVTNPKAKRVRASAIAVPAERLLIETDSPDFSPAGCAFPNEPANLIHVARAVAGLRGVSVEALAELTFDNAERFFRS